MGGNLCYCRVLLSFSLWIMAVYPAQGLSVLSVEAIDKSHVEVRFDLPVVSTIYNYTILNEGPLGVPTHLETKEQGRIAILTFGFEFATDESYLLQMAAIYAVGDKGNSLGVRSVLFAWSRLEYLSVVISEVMAKPADWSHQIPEVEYVEIYNRGNDPVDLQHLLFYYGDKSYPFPPYMLASGSFVVICKAEQAALFPSSVAVVPMISFPVMANTAKLLFLETKASKLLSLVDYKESWHSDRYKRLGGWSLECMTLDNPLSDPTRWGSSIDPSGGTPGRANSLFAEDIPDDIAPILKYWAMVEPDRLYLLFSEPMSPTVLADQSHYQISGGLTVSALTIAYPMADQMWITLSDSLSYDEVIAFTVSELEDLSANKLAVPIVLSLVRGAPISGQDLVINEVLFNPTSGGFDYIEIYNRGDKPLDLSDLLLTTMSDNGELSTLYRVIEYSRPILPQRYLLLSKDSEWVIGEYDVGVGVDRISLPGFPSLPDDHATILLLSRAGEQIDRFSYTDKMHSPWLKFKEGYALERLHPSLSSSDAGSWSSSAVRGTPGLENSQYREPEDSGDHEVVIEECVFSPNGDGWQDQLEISYLLSQTGDAVANISVFTPTGNRVARVVEQQILGPSGSLFWDGRSASGSLLDSGIYLIYVEICYAWGWVSRYKQAIAIEL